MSVLVDNPRVSLPGRGTLNAEWIASAREFRLLQAEWRHLFERSGAENPFLSFEWMGTWWNHFGKGSRPALVTVRNSDGRLVALAPFRVSRSMRDGLGARRLSFLADTHVGSDHLGILAEPAYAQAAAEEIARVVIRERKRWDYIAFQDAANGAPVTYLADQLELHGMLRRQMNASNCPHTSLADSFDEYLAGISTGRRTSFRRRFRKIQRDHGAEFLMLSEGSAIEAGFPELNRLHRMRAAQHGRNSAFVSPELDCFHMDAMEALAGCGRARLAVLRVKGEVVAALYGFVVGKTFSFYQCGMDPAWRSGGVGQVVLGLSIREAIRAGCSDYDFLRGEEPYKFEWGCRTRRDVTIRLFDRRPASLVALAWLHAVMAGRRVKSLVRKLLQRPASPPPNRESEDTEE
jgi:CelD/BcsL family acetyltransferase involved in cellulose biosynthesis